MNKAITHQIVFGLLLFAFATKASVAQTQGTAKAALAVIDPATTPGNVPDTSQTRLSPHVTDQSHGAVDADYQEQQRLQKQVDKDARDLDAALRAQQFAEANRLAADLKFHMEQFLATNPYPRSLAIQPTGPDGGTMNEPIDRNRHTLFDPPPGVKEVGKEVSVQKVIGAGGSLELIFDAGLEACIVNANRNPDVHGGFLLLSYSKYRKKSIWVKTDQTGYNSNMKPGESQMIRLPIYQGNNPQSVETTIEVKYWSYGR